MVTVDNLASRLLLLTSEENSTDNFNEWRLLGQESDESFLFSWVKTNLELGICKTCIGVYNYEENTLDVLYCFEKKVDCIQASINHNRKILLYVIKEKRDDINIFIYKSFLYNIGEFYENSYEIRDGSEKQTFVQFLRPKQISQSVKFLLLIHQEGIYQYQFKLSNEKVTQDTLTFDLLVKNFFWAQWDPVEQTLYHIHNKSRSADLENTGNVNNKIIPTLTGLQFNDDHPHESVLNIPLTLPHLNTSLTSTTYEDNVIPLRVHDSSLDLIVLSNSKGCICICHHYLYQPIRSSVYSTNEDDTAPINFAYSVTALHQSCVIHCIINEIPWNRAKNIIPLFKFRGDSLLVFIPEICTHLLDIGLMHEPYCHIITDPLINHKDAQILYLAPLLSADDYIINLTNLDLIDTGLLESLLVNTFKSTTLENKLSILHYFINHLQDIGIASELIHWQSLKPFSMDYAEILKEYLIATSYALVEKNLPKDVSKIAMLLPITTQRLGLDIEIQKSNYLINLSQEVVWNASMMVLSPQLRIVPYKNDIWLKLWNNLAKFSKVGLRFQPKQVLEKLSISLDCYQPEALSRCTTPTGGVSSTLNDFLNAAREQTDRLPFYEIDSCTASRQEHIISVNLRELSMHLLKQTSNNSKNYQQSSDQSNMHIHAVATRYVGAQLDQSRQLCHIVCKAATYDSRKDQHNGFLLINHLDKSRRSVLFKLLEKFYMAVESLAFPLPQGFTSFFTYLGYKTIDFNMFLQYVNNHVFELQVDVMKIILTEGDNTIEVTNKKLLLLSVLPRQRAKRLLNQWNHPISAILRAREHSYNILSGVAGLPTRSKNLSTCHFKNAHQIGKNMSPLDTFLDLLTAKASLSDIDFGLLIEATDLASDLRFFK